jgi:hypothetical protein
MSNSPINFTAEILQTIRGIRAQQQAAQRAGIARGVSMFNGNNPAIEALMQQRGLGQYGQSSSKARANAGMASVTGSVAGALGGSLGGADANSISATGFNPNTGNTTPTYNNLDSLQNSSANTTVGNVATDAMAGVGGVAPQVQTGSFSPDASIAAEGIFGSEESRGIQPYKKPLINF